MLTVAQRRTEAATPEALNQRIRRRTAASLARVLSDRPRAIQSRLEELEREWDVERALALTASSFVLVGTVLAAARGPRWLALSGVVSAFLLEHAIQGWCPPLPLLRAFGFRTSREIHTERAALKAARGDFGSIEDAREMGPNTLLTLAEI